jgi:hypothetical protein
LLAKWLLQISENADFGRSVFERLRSVGCGKHFLNIQYRMHPEISRFPVSKFYGGQIHDGSNVISESYGRHFLSGNMFGPYSFINVCGGRETSEEHSRSPKNTIEIAVVSLIVERLFQGHSSYKLTMLILLTCCHYLAWLSTHNIFSLFLDTTQSQLLQEQDYLLVSCHHTMLK